MSNLFNSDFIQNLVRDLKSMRSLWNYVYLWLYAYLCYKGIKSGDPEVIKTAILSTAGIVGVIFSVYVYSKGKDKTILPQLPGMGSPSPAPGAGGGDGGLDSGDAGPEETDYGKNQEPVSGNPAPFAGGRGNKNRPPAKRG